MISPANQIDALLPHVRHPARYAGGEWNTATPEPAATVRAVVAHPELYEVATRDPEVERLYRLYETKTGVSAERTFLAAEDLEQRLRAHDLPLFTLESRAFVRDAHLLHIVLPDTLAVLNVPALLEQIGLPPFARDREEGAPLVVASGPFTATPAAIADFIDIVLIGEADDAASALVERLRDGIEAELPRTELVVELARTIEGAWAPGLHDETGEPVVAGLNWPIRPAAVLDLERAFHADRAIVPSVAPTDPCWSVEASRGSPDGSVRYRSAECVLRLVESGYAATGFDRIRLDGPRIERHPSFGRLLHALARRLTSARVSVAIPGLDREAQLVALPRLHDAALDRPRPFSLTPTAPLRADEPIDDETRDTAIGWAEAAYRAGATSIRVEAVCGADRGAMAGIGRLCRDISRVRSGFDSRRGRVDLVLSAPAANEPPGDWATVDELETAFGSLREELGRRRDVRTGGDSPGTAHARMVLHRASRTIAPALAALASSGYRYSELAFDRDGRADWRALSDAITKASGSSSP